MANSILINARPNHPFVQFYHSEVNVNVAPASVVLFLFPVVLRKLCKMDENTTHQAKTRIMIAFGQRLKNKKSASVKTKEKRFVCLLQIALKNKTGNTL